MLITIEGVDCSGKETQSKLLAEKLIAQGKKVARFSYPFYDSPTGRIIGRQYLGKDNNSYFEEGASKVDPYVASLYFAADRKYNEQIIEKALKENDFVILDRYVYSNMAHQGCKLGFEKQEAFFKFISKLEFDMLKLPKPDKIIFLYLPVEDIKKLRSSRKERADGHEADDEYLLKADQTYLKMSEMFGFYKINCSQNGKIRLPEEISTQIYNFIKK